MKLSPSLFTQNWARKFEEDLLRPRSALMKACLEWPDRGQGWVPKPAPFSLRRWLSWWLWRKWAGLFSEWVHRDCE